MLNKYLLTLSILTPLNSLPSIKLKQKTTGERIFIENNNDGREVFFHGVNAIVKGYPYIPETEYFDIDISLSKDDHKTLSDLGVNVYRLGSMWKGLEAVRGVYDINYMNKLDQIVTEAEEYGIYTLLDMHQDDFSEKFCGEGVPDWAAIPSSTTTDDGFPYPLQEPFTDKSTIDGFPTRQDCAKFNWPSYYNTKACGSAFENLYTNVDGLLDSWADFWVEIVKKFDSRSSVLGIELINEPWAGDTVSNLKLLIPSYADKHMLQPAYDYLATKIRQVSNDILIFFAAVTWDDVIPNGFTNAPGGSQYAENSVFAYHYYEPPQFNEKIYFTTRLNDAKRLQTGSMLTEFERSDPTSGNTTDGFVETADAADAFLQSWAMWEYKTFCKETDESLQWDSQAAAFGSCKTGYGSHLIWSDDGTQNMDASRKLARTYPQAVAGSTQSFKFDTTTGDFQLVYIPSPTITAPTVIFAHQELNYPTGMKVTITPFGSATWQMGSKKNTIEIHVNNGKINENDHVTVKIQRK